jgi:hypothetical protein
MTFLNPAILFGLFAAAIPIVLHFLNLRKLKKIEFSTLAFLKELQKTKIRRIKFKQWLLLLLRILIIVLLVMAFARPVLKSITIGDNSATKTTAIILIDNTFSMSVVGNEGSFLNKAKQIAKNLLSNFQQGDEVVILPFYAGNNELPVATTNFIETKKSIDNIEISYISHTINSALTNAVKLLNENKSFNKEIYLITDFQKGRLYNSSSELSNFGSTLSAGTRMFLIYIGSKNIMNLGIESVILNNQIFEKGKLISISTKIKNYSEHIVNNNVVSLLINGKRSAQQNVAFTSGEIKEISFETTLQDTGLVEISVELEDDDLLYDNKRFATVFVPHNISLLALYDKADDLKFIKLALGIPNSKFNYKEYSINQISSLNVNDYSAIIVSGTDGFNSYDKIKGYLAKGGNVILLPGSQSLITTYQNLCNALGVAVPTSLIGKISGKDLVSQFGRIDYQHPLLRDLFQDNKKLQIQSPDIFAYYRLPSNQKSKNIISLIDNSLFLSEFKIDKGKVLLFNSPMVLGWNDLALKSVFAPLINKLIIYCAAKIKDDSNYVAGDEITADISGSISHQIEIETPNLNKEYFSTDSLTNKNYFHYKAADQIGIYKIWNGKKLLDYFSINHDPCESKIEKCTDSEFKDYTEQIGYIGSIYSLSADTDFGKMIYQFRFGTELWKYYLVMVLLLAIVESLISRNSKKEMVQQ